MDGRAPLAAFAFALVVAALAIADTLLQGRLDRQAFYLLVGGAAPVVAFAVMGLSPRRRLGFAI